MYEGFFKPRTLEDDTREERERTYRFMGGSGQPCMRVGGGIVGIYCPPTHQFDIEDKMQELFKKRAVSEQLRSKMLRIEKIDRAASRRARLARADRAVSDIHPATDTPAQNAAGTSAQSAA